MVEIFEILKEYNFWQKGPENLGYIRAHYLNKIKKYIDTDLIKVLIGQRRVGKSYIMRQIIQHLLAKKVNPGNIFYLNKEIVGYDSIVNYRDLYDLIEFYQKKLQIKGKVYVFIDEVQEISDWEKIINSLSQDYQKSYEVFITGSNSKLLSGELATYLSGRYIDFEIFPFSFEEYTDYHQVDKDKVSFINYIKKGGLPELYKLKEEETRSHYITALLNTILLKDIVQRYKIKNIYLLERIFKFIVDNIGNLFSINNVVNYLNSNKINTNFETVSTYINYLLQTLLVCEVDRYDIKGKSILASNKKYYLNDLSFRNYLSSSFDKGLGHHLENIIFNHYKMLGYKVFVGKIANGEVDFVVEKPGDKKYIQVAYSLANEKIIQREFDCLKNISDSYEKIVFSLDDISIGNIDGIKHLLPWNVL